MSISPVRSLPTVTLVILSLTCGIAPTRPVVAQEHNPVASSRDHQRLAVEAYHSGDYDEFVSHGLAAYELRPTHPGLMYNLAVGYSLSGDLEQAIVWLKRYAATGSITNLESDNLAALQGTPGLQEVAAQMEINAQPIGASSVAFELNQPDILAEGIAHDPLSGDFFVSSVHKRKIIRISSNHEGSDFTDDQRGMLGILSMRVDPSHGRLWAGSAGLGQVANLDSTENGSSAVLMFDLESGAVLKSFSPRDDVPHVFGDLTTSSSGDVYVSDSRSPAVYRIAADGDSLELLVSGYPLVSPQGLAFDPDETFLFVADYSTGIVRIDMNTGAAKVLPHPDGSTLLGIDGLSYHDGSLIGIQNGINPNRVLKLELSDDLNRVAAIHVIEANNPHFDEPTQGVVVGESYYYIANSQWGLFTEDGQVVDASLLKNPKILVVKP